MADAQHTPPLAGLARTLIQAGKLSETEAVQFLAKAKETKTTFTQQVVAAGKASALEIARIASEALGYPLLDIASFDPIHAPPDVLNPKLVATHKILPLHKRGNRLSVATADPTQQAVFDQIRFQTNLAIDVVVVEEDKLLPVLTAYSQTVADTLQDMAKTEMDMSAFEDEEELPSVIEEESNQSTDAEDAPVVKFLQKVLLDAINDGASDIHFEPYEKYYRIRFRIDGGLREITNPPLAIKDKLASRIKVISRLNIAEKRVPQDGRMKLVLSKTRAIDFRVSTLPTLHGEKIVMRILDPTSATLGIDALGYEPEQKAALLDAVTRPYGMVLVTGPTGSGKTVSLYTCLNILNEPGVNISTAEDPAEINLAGINQVNVDDKAGLTFAAALKSFLRQDPDIIMVGEIRDLETAEISIKAAQTGHLVLSTLHTNDAPQTLTRMLNMGIPPFNIASSVHLITAQRLARRLCSCKQPIDIPAQALLDAGFTPNELDGTWLPYGPVGCDRCKGSGYKGRVGIYQVMPVSEDMQRIIMNHGNSMDIAEQARKEGVKSLRESGLLKVKQGLTSLEEVLSTTNM